MNDSNQPEARGVLPLNGRHLITYLVVGILSATSAIIGVGLRNRVQPAPIIIEPPAPTATPLPTPTPSPIRVFINGEVARPDVYTLPPDAIVKDLVEMAGGFTAEAYREVVNLALVLDNGMQIYVPSLAEFEAGEVAPPALVESGKADATVPNAAVDTSGGGSSGLINLNSATQAELETLPGVGPSTAQKIIDYREANGLFISPEALMEVSGIGPAKFAAMEAFITVDE